MTIRKVSLATKLGKLEQFVRVIKKLQKTIDKKKFFDDDFIQKTIERYLQLTLEACIDIANHIINEYRFEKGESYKSIFLVLGKEKVLPTKFAEEFSRAAGFRNILVHGYIDLDEKKVFEHFKKDAGDIEKFMKYIVKYTNE